MHFKISISFKICQVCGGGCKPALNMMQGGQFAYTQNSHNESLPRKVLKGTGKIYEEASDLRCL